MRADGEEPALGGDELEELRREPADADRLEHLAQRAGLVLGA